MHKIFMENHGIVFLNFCGNPEVLSSLISSPIRICKWLSSGHTSIM